MLCLLQQPDRIIHKTRDLNTEWPWWPPAVRASKEENYRNQNKEHLPAAKVSCLPLSSPQGPNA